MQATDRIDVLVVDDDAEFRETIVRRLRRRGYHVHEAGDGEEALRLNERRQFTVAVLDMMLPDLSGIDLLEKLKVTRAECEVILLTGQGSIETAVQAMKSGAYDYVTKPCSLAEFEVLIEKAAERGRLSKENWQLKEVIKRAEAPPQMIGESPAMRELYRLIGRAAPADKAILIQGESGTGKELVARALHRQSGRADKPLVVVNCAALTETLLESELFGHEKGSFTGAIAAKPGLFEMADGGTLFIDEIGEMPGALQAKLLRVLEDGSMRRVGSLKERRVDVRLLAATNRCMSKEVAAGRFREDLFYRINVMSLELPPLRERIGDIPVLIRHFLGKDWGIEPEAMEMLERYAWPGNVRQLINALERARIMSDDQLVHLADLPQQVIAEAAASKPAKPYHETDVLSDIERAHVVEVLERERGNKARAARILGLNRRSLYRLIEKYGIELPE